jgi:hypothetical protein
MGCNCGKKAQVKYRVDLGPTVPAPAQPIIKDSAAAARQAIVAAGNPEKASFTAVPVR